jgi:hypothetical protein
MAAAIHLEIISNILPVEFGPEIGRRSLRGQPIRTTQAQRKPHDRPAQIRTPRNMRTATVSMERAPQLPSERILVRRRKHGTMASTNDHSH